MDYHSLLADGVETDDENTDFHFSRSVCNKHRRCRLDNAANGTGCPAHEGRERQNIPFAFVWTLTHCSYDGALYKSTFYLLTYLFT